MRRASNQRINVRERTDNIQNCAQRPICVRSPKVSADEFAHPPLKGNDLEALGLQKGGTVVDLGCGTGLNFSCFNNRSVPMAKS